jgi:uncharacterized protein (TIGR02466 family)
MNTLGLFPTPFVIDNIEKELDIFEIEKLIEFSKNKEELIDNFENGNFFHKNTKIIDSLPKLNSILTEKTNKFLYNVMGEQKSNLKITQSWLNVNPPESYHHFHSHKNSIVSGVLYIDCMESSGEFRVYKPETLKRDIGGGVIEHNPFTYEYIKFIPNKFDLYLFPSNLKHSVEKNKSDKNRLSIAFNTFYLGELDTNFESLSKLTITECS